MQPSDRKIISILFFTLFSVVTGVGIVVPLLPVYAKEMGATGLYIGLIFASFSFSRTVLLPYFGRLSDQKGRKPFILFGLCGYTMIAVALLLATDVQSLIVIRFIQGAASAMIMPVVQAYVGDITPPGKEGQTMGWFNMSVFLGLSIGPLMGGAINDYFSLQTAFACMGLLALISFMLGFFWLPPTRFERNVNLDTVPAAWRTLLMDREIAGLFCFRFSYTACIGIIWGFLPVFADIEFSMTSSAIGFLVMLGVTISGLMHGPMGYLADRFNKSAMVTIGGLIVGVSVYAYGEAVGFMDMILASTAFGIGGGVCMPPLMAMAVLKGSASNAMGSVIALLTMAHSMGMLVGALMAGLMMDLFQLRQVFPFGALLMISGVVVFWITKGGRHAS